MSPVRLDFPEEMMPEGDAEEGIRSFLERREARWSRNEVMV
jgi:hypothetical protein